jgi:alkylhydroperoxidase/carboxymuconolactone decarboxylase family protein YurZ
MPTNEEKQAELRRVTKLAGFRVGLHDFYAEVDFDHLKKRNDRWEAREPNQSRLERITQEFIKIAAYVALEHSVPMIQIHIHAAHQAGATPEQIYEVIDSVGGWSGNKAKMLGFEAWRLVFRPDIPTIFRVVELTADSPNK